MGYSDKMVKELCNKYLKLGFTHFKVKVGTSIEDDLRRCNLVREAIGDKNTLVSYNRLYHVQVADFSYPEFVNNLS